MHSCYFLTLVLINWVLIPGILQGCLQPLRPTDAGERAGLEVGSPREGMALAQKLQLVVPSAGGFSRET